MSASYDLTPVLSHALGSAEYSDLTISLSNGEQLPCHRIVLCPQCDYIAQAVKKHAQPNSIPVVPMHAASPPATKALINFLYTRTYAAPPAGNSNGDNDANDDGDDGTAGAELLFHLGVYAAATTYAIPTLAHHARATVLAFLATYWHQALPSLPAAVAFLYAHVPAHACGVRRPLQELCVANMESLVQQKRGEHGEKQSVLGALFAEGAPPCFLQGVVEGLWGEVRWARMRCYRCSACARVFAMPRPPVGGGATACGVCGVLVANGVWAVLEVV